MSKKMKTYGAKPYQAAKAQARTHTTNKTTGTKTKHVQSDYGDGRYYRNSWLISDGNASRPQMVRGKRGQYHVIGVKVDDPQPGLQRRAELQALDLERTNRVSAEPRKAHEIGKWQPKRSTKGIC